MDLCSEELDYWGWALKINERLTFLILKVKDRREISEDEYQLLRVLYPVWWDGHYPLYQTKMEGIAVSTTQASLFDVIPSDTIHKTDNGTTIDNKETELKI